METIFEYLLIYLFTFYFLFIFFLQEKISSVGNMALYLFRALPLELWEPSADDITCVSHWLLFTPVASIENQLARIVLSKLNWGENAYGIQLFLPPELHRRVSSILAVVLAL